MMGDDVNSGELIGSGSACCTTDAEHAAF